jgi:glycosyltransferase involved in cell wall biosynthesis
MQSSPPTSTHTAPLVSVVIPAYNEARWLPACLQSLKAQTYPNLEIIVVNDGSTDETETIAHSFGVLVLTNEHPRGEMVSRNIGWHHAKGELVAEIEADAIYPQDFFERAVPYFLNHPNIAGLIRGYLRIHPDRTGVIASYWDLKRQASYVLKQHGRKKAELGCQIGRRSAFVAVNGYDESLKIGGDVDMARRMEQRGLTLMWAPDLFFWHADPATLKHTLKRIWMHASGSKPFAVRWGLWPTGWRSVRFFARTLFVTLIPVYLLLAFIDPAHNIAWFVVALAALSLESIGPIVFHAETRTLFILSLQQRRWGVALLLPVIMFLQLRASAYGKIYAMVTATTTMHYHTDY